MLFHFFLVFMLPTLSLKPINFYIDNQATLKNLIKPWKTKDTNIHRIYSKIQKLAFAVTFTYVPAHKGHTGNELADRAAKIRLLQPISLFPKIPKHHLHDLIDKTVATITDHRWNSVTHSHWLQLLFPTSKALRNFLSISKGLLQVRKLASGYYPLQNYLFQRSLAPSPHCLHCQTSQMESIFHRVFICETFQHQRTILFLKLDFFPRNTMEILLSKDRNNLQAFDAFLTACKQRR